MSTTAAHDLDGATGATVWDLAAAVPDPELPMVTLADLGILRSATVDGDAVTVTITPTYSGCPAMREMSADLRNRLERAGFDNVTVRTQLSPAWSSDWITAQGRAKLAAGGIAPPGPASRRAAGPVPLTLLAPPRLVACPHCGSTSTRETAAFSATACKALRRCDSCHEPFENVKEI
ncbi:MAG: 1,2-phenylacetyl-CoA epoxidase subunit PaaD [Mycobacteriaceae bacterium]